MIHNWEKEYQELEISYKKALDQIIVNHDTIQALRDEVHHCRNEWFKALNPPKENK